MKFRHHRTLVVGVVAVVVAAALLAPFVRFGSSPSSRPTATSRSEDRPLVIPGAPPRPESSSTAMIRVGVRDRDRARYVAIQSRVERAAGVVLQLVSLDALVDRLPSPADGEPSWRPVASVVLDAVDVLPIMAWTNDAGRAGDLVDMRAEIRRLGADVRDDALAAALLDPTRDEPLWAFPAGIRPILIALAPVAVADAPVPERPSWSDILALAAPSSTNAPPRGVAEPTLGVAAAAGLAAERGVDLRRAPHVATWMRSAAAEEWGAAVCRLVADNGLLRDPNRHDQAAATAWRADDLAARDAPSDARWVPLPPPATPGLAPDLVGWSISARAPDRAAAWRVVLALAADADALLDPDALPVLPGARERSLFWRRLSPAQRQAVLHGAPAHDDPMPLSVAAGIAHVLDAACDQGEALRQALDGAADVIAQGDAPLAAHDAAAPPPPPPPPPSVDDAMAVVRLGGVDQDAVTLVQRALAADGILVRATERRLHDPASVVVAQSDCALLPMPLDAATTALAAPTGDAATAAPAAARAAVADSRGVMRAIPVRASAPLLVFRPSVVRAALGDLPSGEWTWEDVARLAERAPTAVPGVYGYVPSSAPVEDLLRYLTALHGPLASARADGRMQLRFDDPQIADAALRYFAMAEPLRAEGLRWYDPDGAVVDHVQTVIAEKRAALWVLPSDAVPWDDDVAVAPWPSGGGLPWSAVGLEALVLRNDSPAQAACRAVADVMRHARAAANGMTPLADRPADDPRSRAVWRSLSRPLIDDVRVALPSPVRRWFAQAMDVVWEAPPQRRAALMRDRLAWVQRRADEYAQCVSVLQIAERERECALLTYPDDPWHQRSVPSGDPPTGD